MIWYYLLQGIRYLAYLFGKPNLAKVAIIDVNAKCPVCGHCSGKLQAVEAMVGNFKTIACLHTCNVDGARWFEQSVVKADHVIAAASSGIMITDPAILDKAVDKSGRSIAVMRAAQQ